MGDLDHFCVKCLAAGDEEAFVALYGKYHKKVYFTALKLLQSDETAKDITQTVFMKIWEHRLTLDPNGNFAAYLHTVCRNAIFDEFKRASLDEDLKTELQQFSSETDEDDDFREKYYRLLDEAIAKLPPQRRAVFEACRLRRQSYDQVARKMNIARSTVQDHIVKANKFIRDYVREHGDVFLLILCAVVLGI
ncbi:MAG: RNA polymerase sigma-70 factor [Tannerella sp.]|jgi:RNA polymerase sigma-70 factor (ECF subfamily)|nr:RNA polymerase sigma-70 factor [Tannerella sp.]